jgi:hypothetical protein
MKIYDCFPFYNELDLLEVRLSELYDHVDHFVLVEGSTTFTDLPKPYYFEENKHRFSKYLDKIIHIKVDDMPHSNDAWVNDIFQRNAINRGLSSADEDDIIIVTDLDELIRPETVDEMRLDTDINIWALRMPLFNFKFNYMLTTADKYGTWGMACRNKFMIPADELRHQRFELNGFPYGYRENGIRIMEHAGWQFTYFGDTKFAENKIKSFAHTETNTPEVLMQLNVDRSIENGDGIYHHPEYRFTTVKLNEYFPKTITDNLDKYQQYVVQGADQLATDFLPNK